MQFAYATLVYYLGLTRGNWVYPFLGMLTMPGRIAFSIASLFLVSFYYVIGENIHKMMWRSKVKTT